MAGALSLPIETERLCLREFCRSDVDALHAYASRDEVTQYLMWGPNDRQASDTQLSTFIEAAAATPRTIFELALCLKADGRVIGALCLYLDDASDDGQMGAELGFVLHSDFWGQGMATEAAKALLSHGLSELDLAHVWATCDARNLGSIGVLEKIGMFRQETVRGARATGDGQIDELRYVFPAP